MKHLDTLPDDELLTLLQRNGESRAFEALYNRYFAPVYRYVYKVMQDKETAEDLVQNIFIGLWKNVDKLHIENLRAYLFGAARNQIAKHLRKSKFNLVQLEYIDTWEASRITEDYLQEQDTRTAIEAAIGRLPKKCKNAFELSRFGFLTNKEIATKMGISVFTVENHIKKALYYLRQSIEIVVLVFISL